MLRGIIAHATHITEGVAGRMAEKNA